MQMKLANKGNEILLPVAGCRLPVAGCWLLVTGYWFVHA
jgi:hypothetical protein